MKQTHALVVEDEQDIRDLISFQLRSNGHAVTLVENADEALVALARSPAVDLFIIDWMLPGTMSGLEFTKRLRTLPEYRETPVIMVTALTQPENIVAGLEAGADDYVTKPFDLKVLEARVRVQLRDHKDVSSDVIEEGPLRIELTKCRVLIDGEEVSLTSTEFKILSLLARKPGHVYTREQFISHIQGESIHVTGRTIDTHIAGLRKKIGAAATMVETIRGIGYRFRDA